jgi:hypothetical protein
MRQYSPGFIIGIVGSIILGFGVVAGIVIGLRSNEGLGYNPPALQAIKTGPGTAELDLSTFPDSQVCHPDAPNPEIGWVTYCATNPVGAQGTTLEVPPNSLITVVIRQYDSATGLYNDFFDKVQGTIGGTATYNGKVMSQIKANDTAHTFNLQSPPFADHPLFVSVPLLGVADDAPNKVNINGNPYPTPTITTFQFRTGAGGTYIWHCYVPCGNDRESPYGFSGAMSTTGYMAGTLTVASY